MDPKEDQAGCTKRLVSEIANLRPIEGESQNCIL